MKSLIHLASSHQHGCRFVTRLMSLALAVGVLANAHVQAQEGQSQRSLQPTLDSQASASALDADYAIREGDMIQVTVFNEPELTASGRVRRDGTLQCPLIGSIRILGLSQLAAARVIEEAYRKDYLVNPDVNLSISQFSVQHVTVLGQVLRPGSHDLPAEKRLTILQVLGMAGGPTRIGNLKRVMVKRTINGRQQTFKVDVNSMVSGSESAMFYVQEDDVITVPEGMF